MDEGDGVYYSGSAYSGSRSAVPASDERTAARLARRAKKAAVAVVGLGAVGAGAYFGTTLLSGNTPGYVPGGSVALAPAAPATSTPPPTLPTPAQPSPGPQVGTRSGARRAARPSPTPSELARIDDEAAAAQVGRLLRASPRPSSSAMAIQGAPVTVSRETGTDGSVIRVVAAHYDLTRWWSPADRGRPVGDARCTRALPTGADPEPQPRPAVLTCWRTGPARSVVTVAVSRRGRPLDAASVAVLDRAWSALD